jgi:uncharacterized repeat protein (TIGR01451 family)
VKTVTYPHITALYEQHNLLVSDGANSLFSTTSSTSGVSDLYISFDVPHLKNQMNLNKVIIGDNVNYNLLVGNFGPIDAIDSNFKHYPPYGLSNVNWTCSNQSGKATCPSNQGEGGIDLSLNLPNNSSLMFTVNADVTELNLFSLLLTSTITPPDEINDDDLNNNIEFIHLDDFIIYKNNFE